MMNLKGSRLSESENPNKIIVHKLELHLMGHG